MRDVTVSRISNRYLTQKSDNDERSETGDGGIFYCFLLFEKVYIFID